MKQRDLLFLLGSSFVIVFAWIGFNIYNSFVTSTITETLNVQIQPIESRFDLGTLQHLKNRLQIDAILTLSGSTVATETAETIEPTPTPEETISQIEEATGEAEIATDEAQTESESP